MMLWEEYPLRTLKNFILLMKMVPPPHERSQHLLPVTFESASVKPHYLRLPERDEFQLSDFQIESQIQLFL